MIIRLKMSGTELIKEFTSRLMFSFFMIILSGLRALKTLITFKFLERDEPETTRWLIRAMPVTMKSSWFHWSLQKLASPLNRNPKITIFTKISITKTIVRTKSKVLITLEATESGLSKGSSRIRFKLATKINTVAI